MTDFVWRCHDRLQYSVGHSVSQNCTLLKTFINPVKRKHKYFNYKCMLHSICMRPCSFSDFGAVAVNCLLRPYRRSVMYFRFRGWRHVRRQSAGRGDAVVTQSDSPGAAPDRGRSLMFMIASLLQGVTRTIVVSIPVCVCVCVWKYVCARGHISRSTCVHTKGHGSVLLWQDKRIENAVFAVLFLNTQHYMMYSA